MSSHCADVSGPFRPEHHCIGYTPAMRLHAEAGAHSFSDIMKLGRVREHWLVKSVRVGTIEKH